MALQLKSKPFRPGGSGSSNGFQSLGLSDAVYGGILRMGFRVRYIMLQEEVYLAVLGCCRRFESLDGWDVVKP
jgi:hypothetical protein